MLKLKVTDIDIKNKKLLIRVDFNVPLKSDGSIADMTRIKESLPTIRYALDKGASVILMSHLGRPEGKKNSKYSLAVCASALSSLLKQNVKMAPDCIGIQTEQLAKDLNPQEVLLLENLRFYPAEENPELDAGFARQLATLANVYVNDAFAADHRKHSSTATIAKYFPQNAVMGLLLEKEVEALSYLTKNPSKPFHAIIGGAKVSTKIGVLHALAKKTNTILLGGGMTYTFMLAKGIEIGESIHDKEGVETAESFINMCKERNVSLHLPDDIVIREKGSKQIKVISLEHGIPKGWEGMDIGPNTRVRWNEILSPAKTVFWNGPLGVFEIPPFNEGTSFIAKTLANLENAKTFIGGGDSLAAIAQLNLSKKFTHLSTGGGASLEFLEYGTLPGIEALSDRKC